MTIQALAGYVHTVYPVLLASADFNDWWVVADRRHAYPQPFWRARTSKAGTLLGGFHSHGGTPIAGWFIKFIMENPRTKWII
jgi:hypothetical protein